MSPVTIESVPSGADVSIDGVSVGTTPISVDIVSDDLYEFRDTCLTDEQVSCGWSTLETWLEDQRVSGFWWEMTTPERRSVAMKAIENTLLIKTRSWSLGMEDCGGSDDVPYPAVCYQNMIIRYLKFQSEDDIVPYDVGADSCYWYDHVSSSWNCFHPSVCYRLPGHYILRVPDGDAGHAMASVQVDPDMSSLDSWIIFQYYEVDIKPGDWHLAIGSDVRVLKIDQLGCNMFDEGPTIGIRVSLVTEFHDVR